MLPENGVALQRQVVGQFQPIRAARVSKRSGFTTVHRSLTVAAQTGFVRARQIDFMTASAPPTRVDLVAQTTEALEEGANDVDYRM